MVMTVSSEPLVRAAGHPWQRAQRPPVTREPRPAMTQYTPIARPASPQISAASQLREIVDAQDAFLLPLNDASFDRLRTEDLMDVLAVTDLNTVVALLNYLVPMA